METLTPVNQSSRSSSAAVRTILLAWIVAGTMDLSMALIVWSVVLKKITAVKLLQGIASGVFGQEAFTGGRMMIVFGIVFHYTIVFSFTLLYFFAFRFIPFMQKQKVISGLLYGIFAWAFMKYIVLPLSLVQQSPFKWSSALISIAILMVCIGLPISLIVSRYYKRSRGLFS